jgi:hypothetical protein
MNKLIYAIADLLVISVQEGIQFPYESRIPAYTGRQNKFFDYFQICIVFFFKSDAASLHIYCRATMILTDGERFVSILPVLFASLS